MKKFLVGAAAAAAILAPVAASADTNAVVGVQYANNEFDSFDFDSYGFNAALSHDFDSTFLQFDGEFNRVDADGCCNTSGYGAMHYGVRNDSYAFAGVVSLNDFFGYSGLGYGVEGAMYFSNFVVDRGGCVLLLHAELRREWPHQPLGRRRRHRR
jgi:opacity protein-like surface antigen